MILVGNVLYATDFAQNKVTAFDNTFTPLPYPFFDPNAFGSPFSIQYIGGNLDVAYASKSGTNPIAGTGLGKIVTFDLFGNFIKTLVNNGLSLNEPYGMTFIQQYFAQNSATDFLVANHGD